MKKIITIWIVLLVICFWLSQVNSSIAKEKKEKIPTGLKTKMEIEYQFVEEFGTYKKVLGKKTISQYDKKGNQIERAEYDVNGKLTYKFLCKYDDRGNMIELARYGADGKLWYKDIYKYDDRSNKIEEDEYDVDGKFVCLQRK